jgi:hypothetical protein
MKTLGGSRNKKRMAWHACVATCLVLFALNGAALADGTTAPPITEPANAPGATSAPAPAANATAAAPTTSAPAPANAAANPNPSSPAAGSSAPSAPAPAYAQPASNSAAPTSAASTTAPRTLPLPAGAVAVPPLTGQTATLDPNNPAAAGFDSNSDIVNYERFQNPDAFQSQMPVQQFMNDEDNVIAPLGVEVREDQRKLKSGESAIGLLIVSVSSGSPAAKAGLHSHTDVTRNVLEGAAVAGALVFPPAVLLAPIIASVPLGESYDLIIAVDGWRVMNLVEFTDRLRELQPGEIVYLSIIRDGSRLQVPVQIPQDVAAATSH